jgi:signal transduction histidine kinase
VAISLAAGAALALSASYLALHFPPGLLLTWIALGATVAAVLVAGGWTGNAADEDAARVVAAAGSSIVTMTSAGEVLGLNPAAERLFGRTSAATRGKSIRALLPALDLGTAPRERLVEEMALRADHSLLPVALTLGGSGNLCVATVTDVTHEKRNEGRLLFETAAMQNAGLSLLKAKDAAEAASRFKSEFLAHVSHEIRTPMTAIQGYTEQLLRGNMTEGEARDALLTIQRNGIYLLQILNDLLDLSKIEANKLEIVRTDCAPLEVVRDVVRLFRARADEKGLFLRIEAAGPIPDLVRTDPLRLRQILVNLVSNALKFTRDGGITISLGLEHAQDGRRELGIRVTDTGIGMTEAHLAQLFEPFHQGDTEVFRHFGGTGLGLAISRRLARLLDGDIRVESRPGSGSAFRLGLDVGSLSGVAMLEASVEPASGMPAAEEQRIVGRVLLAEDGVDSQRLIAMILRKAGAEVTVVDDGDRAFDATMAAAAAGRPFDLVIMDMQMPRVDGHEATLRLRRANYRGPIMVLTASAVPGDRERCLSAGCDGFAAKPLDRAAFLRDVSALLRVPALAGQPGPAATVR